MISLDTNVLARFYCDDPEDLEAKRQRPLARRVILESQSLFVPLTVVLELEWVMRGLYHSSATEFCEAIKHLMGMSHVTVERWEIVRDALSLHLRGLDFADALHWATSRDCASLATFDDRGFSRRANRFGLLPKVTLLT